jgi:3-oxoacyl-[acyl-carrier protein] reductase
MTQSGGTSILITGASRGIGYQTALRFASEKHQVIAVARSRSNLDDLCKEGGKNISSHCVDLSDSAQITGFCRSLSDSGGKISHIIHNAGLLINKPFYEMTDPDWLALLEANLMSAVRLIRELLPVMSTPSHIVLISSMGGFQGSSKFPGLSGYSTSKAALAVLAECLATELSDRQISVNCLCLGAVQTEMLERAFPGYQAPVSADEMAGYLYDFALNGSRYFNGRILPVTLGDPG